MRCYTRLTFAEREESSCHLARQELMQTESIAEAIQYRSLDRQWWG